MAAGIGELLDDPERRAEWGERGRRLVVERYSWPSVTDRVEALYRDVLADQPGAGLIHPAIGLRRNLRRNPVRLVRNIPSALRAGFPGRARGISARR
jgi:hypothetical protein